MEEVLFLFKEEVSKNKELFVKLWYDKSEGFGKLRGLLLFFWRGIMSIMGSIRVLKSN